MQTDTKDPACLHCKIWTAIQEVHPEGGDLLDLVAALCHVMADALAHLNTPEEAYECLKMTATMTVVRRKAVEEGRAAEKEEFVGKVTPAGMI